jgi:hypothetical protein
MRALPCAVGALSYVCLLAAPAAATTYQKVGDPDLADQAPVIVEARVAGAPKPAAGRIPSTDYAFAVERPVRGAAPGDLLTVRVPGGTRPDGLSLQIWGAPRFAPEERALLFLAPNDDGSYHILHLMLGAFHEVAAGDGRKMAARDLSEAREVDGEDAEPPRDLERFRSWLADRVAGKRRAPDYFLAGSLPPGVQEKFNLLQANGSRERWFVFDEGGSVAWAANSSGQPGVPGGGFAEFQRALAAWNAEPTTPVHYAWAGQTNATGGLGRYDGVNAILFDEPVADPFDCDHGGVLAIGGPWFDTRRQAAWGGGTFVTITGADIVTNAGIGCYLARSADPSKAAEEIFGHELGHTLGLGHSCGDTSSGACAGRPAADDALMRSYLHNDGRGARLAPDDRAALQALYRPGSSQALAPPAAPASLIVEASGLTANLLWEDRSADEEGFRVYRRTGNGAFAKIAELPAGTTIDSDPGLKPGTRYEYQVAAFNVRGESRGPRTALALPASQPLQALSMSSRAVTARTGEPVDFSVSFSGPARRAQWEFPGGMELSDAPCAAQSFCATHIFARPGDQTVQVRLLGDLGQTSERRIQVHVEGPEITPADGGTFLASVVPGGDLWLAGEGSSATLARVTFQPLAAGSAPVSRDLTLIPGATLLVPDVLRTLFGAAAQGSLTLSWSGPAAHTFSRARSGPFTGEEPEAGWSAGEKVLAGLPCADGSVATLLVNNLDSAPGQVTVGLLDGMGEEVGNPVVLELGPGVASSQRLDRLFPGIGLHTGPFSARVVSNGIRFAASATLAGGELKTSLLLPAREGAAGNEMLIPRVARGAGAFNTFQFSRLLAANPADQPREILCELWPRGQDGRTARRVVTLTIPPRGSISVEDVLRDLFGMTEALGALKISWSGEGPAPRVLSLAVSTARGGAGDRFAALVDGAAVSPGRPARSVDFGAESSAFARANWGAVNPADAPATLRLSLRSPSGEVVRTAQIALRPRQSLERPLVGIFPQAGSGRWTVTTEVLAGGPVQTYLFQTDAGGDVSFVPGSAE